jgi:hypothetical protein
VKQSGQEVTEEPTGLIRAVRGKIDGIRSETDGLNYDLKATHSKDQISTPPDRSRRVVAPTAGILILAAIGVAASLLYFAISVGPTFTESDPVQVGYVDEQVCSISNEPENAAWTDRNHNLAMKVATNDGAVRPHSFPTGLASDTTTAWLCTGWNTDPKIKYCFPALFSRV